LRTGARQSKLFDFGIAKVVGDGPSRSAILDHGFTPGFAAPEQFDSSYGETGPWTDVFALALLVVEMVSGQEALQGREVVTLGQASCDRHRRPTPRALGIHVGDEVERVLSRALAVDPGRRFADVRPFWNELTSAASLSAKGTTTPFVLLSARPGPVALLVAQPARSPRARGRGHGRAGRKWLPVALVSAMSLAIALIPTHHRAAPRRAAGQQAARASVLAGSLAVDGPTVPERLP
jgi:serine/threonine-protein kinase